MSGATLAEQGTMGRCGEWYKRKQLSSGTRTGIWRKWDKRLLALRTHRVKMAAETVERAVWEWCLGSQEEQPNSGDRWQGLRSPEGQDFCDKSGEHRWKNTRSLPNFCSTKETRRRKILYSLGDHPQNGWEGLSYQSGRGCLRAEEVWFRKGKKEGMFGAGTTFLSTWNPKWVKFQG